MSWLSRGIWLGSWIGITCLASCSPLKTSPKEEKHQLELTLHDLRINLDELRHDVHAVQAEIQILDGKLRSQESSAGVLQIQQQEKMQSRLENLIHQLAALESRLTQSEKNQSHCLTDLRKLSSHANETTEALIQYKQGMKELEDLIVEKGKTEGSSSIKNGGSCKTYKVKSGDSLERIARSFGITTEALKAKNKLPKDQDLIVIGQELEIPNPQ